MKFFIFLFFLSQNASADDGVKIKYQAAKDLNFEKLVIDGSLKRPELAVVTGDSDETTNGLLRLREDFKDRVAQAAGEDAP
jgi:hypothetical protein